MVIEVPHGLGLQPVKFLCADNQAGVDPAFRQPGGPDGKAFEKRRRVADDGIGDGHRSEQSGDVTGRSRKDGFGKQERAGRSWIVHHLAKKPRRILDRARLQAKDKPEPRRGRCRNE